MPVSFDNVTDFSNPGSTNPSTTSYTVNSGSNRLLVVGYYNNSIDLAVTSMTYNGAALTVDSGTVGGGGVVAVYIGYLLNPDVGTHNLVITAHGSPVNQFLNIAQYNGVSSVESDTGGFASSATSLTITTTTAADNEWLIGYFATSGNGSAGTNTTRRTPSGETFLIVDTNADQTPAGSHSIQVTASSGEQKGRMLAVVPVASVLVSSWHAPIQPPFAPLKGVVAY